MQGKRVLITGATNGIGRAAAASLLAQGAQVVIVGRDAAKTAQIAADLGVKTGRPVEYLLADLSSQASIQRLADEVLARYDRLDVLVNNAGGFFDTRRTTVDGIEYTFALNHLAYFLLTNRLLDLLRSNPAARIINVSSSAQANGRMHFDDPQFVTRYQGFPAYAQSKLANVLFTYALARQLTGSSVTVNALHPGVVRTGFGDNAKNWAIRLGFRLLKPFSITPEQGADTVVYLASSPDVAAVSSSYFVRRTAQHSNPVSYDQNVQEQLWALSEQLIVRQPDVAHVSVNADL